MENIVSFFTEYLDYLLLGLILLTGIFITKYTKQIAILNTYKVLFSSVIISVVLYFIEGCDKGCLPKYLFTYFFATSFYELIVKYTMNKMTLIFKNE